MFTASQDRSAKLCNFTSGECLRSFEGHGLLVLAEDVLLLAWPIDADERSVLGWAYHITNVCPGTASKRRGQSYPQRRVLWRHCAPLPDLVRLAANSLAERLGLPVPGCVDSLLDTAVWRTGVKSQAVVSLSVSEQGHDDSDGSDFGSNSDRWF